MHEMKVRRETLLKLREFFIRLMGIPPFQGRLLEYRIRMLLR